MTNNNNIRILLKRGDTSKITALSGFSRQYVYEYLNNPKEWKGSAAAANKIINAVEKVVTERKQREQEAQNRLAKLLNQGALV